MDKDLAKRVTEAVWHVEHGIGKNMMPYYCMQDMMGWSEREARNNGSGEEFLPAVPIMLRIMSERKGQSCYSEEQVLRDIQKMTPVKLVAALVEQLERGNTRMRETVLKVLCKMGKDAEPAAHVLAALLKDEEWNIRYEAGKALVGMGERGLVAVNKALARGTIGFTHAEEVVKKIQSSLEGSFSRGVVRAPAKTGERVLTRLFGASNMHPKFAAAVR